MNAARSMLGFNSGGVKTMVGFIRIVRLVSVVLVASLFLALPARSQTAPPDPAFLAAKAAFEKLDPEARKAIQRDLVWAGGFTGSASGEFGALTFTAIRRFETGAKLTMDGVLAPPERAKLTALADEARAATGFRVEVDPASKMRVGLPSKRLARRGENPAGGGRWQDKDGKVTLDLSPLKGEEGLSALYEKGITGNVPGRKITYKLLRPDFFVISGETAGGKFYRRVDKGPDGALRGLSIGYDKALAKEFDMLVIAIASVFEAFPQGAPAPPANVAARAPAALAAPATPRIALRLTAIAIAEDRFAVAEAAFRACKSPVFDVNGRPAATLVPNTGADGLIAVAGHKASAIPLGQGGATEGVLVQRDDEGALVASQASIVDGKAMVALQVGGAGAAIFDRSGALVGIVTAAPALKYAVAGAMPVMWHKVVPAGEITKMAGMAPVAANPALQISAGEIAAKHAGSILSILCAP